MAWDGLRLGYPLCCVARFTLERCRGIYSGQLRGLHEGGFVPCGIFHRSGQAD